MTEHTTTGDPADPAEAGPEARPEARPEAGSPDAGEGAAQPGTGTSTDRQNTLEAARTPSNTPVDDDPR